MTKKSRNYYDSNISIITAPRGLAKISIIEGDLRYDYDANSTNNHGYRKDAVRTNKVEGPEKWRRDSSERKAIMIQETQSVHVYFSRRSHLFLPFDSLFQIFLFYS
jgi:hypothetical protein